MRFARSGVRYSLTISFATGLSPHPSSTSGTISGQAWPKTSMLELRAWIASE